MKNRKLSEKQLAALLGICVGLTAGAVLRMAVKVLDLKMDVILKKLNLSSDLPEEYENLTEEKNNISEEERDAVPSAEDDMFEE